MCQHGIPRDECTRQEILYSLEEALAVIALRRSTHNRVRLHASSSYRPPAPVSFPHLAFPLPMAAIMQWSRDWRGPKYRPGHYLCHRTSEFRCFLDETGLRVRCIETDGKERSAPSGHLDIIHV